MGRPLPTRGCCTTENKTLPKRVPNDNMAKKKNFQNHISVDHLFTYLLTYSMKQSPWEANRFEASQEISCILWNPNVHYRIHKRPPPVSIPSQLNTVNTTSLHFQKIHLNIIFSSTIGSTKWTLSLRPSHQNPVHTSFLTHMRYMPRPSHSFRFNHPHERRLGIQIMKFLIMKFPPLPFYLVPLSTNYSPQHPILKHLNLVRPSMRNVVWGCLSEPQPLN
jgi:hypothetical protein